MTESIKKISNVIRLNEYLEDEEKYVHLFEIQYPPQNLKNFRPRYNFEQGGTFLVGDLVLDLQEEEYLESHPFPEWVVQLISKSGSSGKAYFITLNLEVNFISRLNKMNYEKRVKKIDEKVALITQEEVFAFEYQIGINIKVPANIPHAFISKYNSNKNEVPPYLQVFEPNLRIFNETLKLKTPYYKLPFKIKV